MKKRILLLMLSISITVNLCAQSNNTSGKEFSVPENIIINRRFTVSLENGNRMQIELTDISDLDRLSNIDSLLEVFFTDMAPLKDSLTDPLAARRIDYFMDAKGRKKIRLQQFPAKAASFLLDKGELASLKTEQDTVNIIGIIANPSRPKEKVSLTNPRYFHLIFYLNNLAELTNYMNGILQKKINTIQANVNGKWPHILGSGNHYLKNDKTISAENPKGFSGSATGDFLTGFITLNAQNYKHYFVPSFSLGLRLTLSNRERFYKWEMGVLWEPHYLFARDDKNALHTYRNDFLTLIYAQGGTRDHDPRKEFSFSSVFSAGYLIHRKGEYFDKNTFRLGAGKIQSNKTAIEPCIYFNNFFKGVTPGIKISQNF